MIALDDEIPPFARSRSRALPAAVILGLLAAGVLAVLLRSPDAPAPLPSVAAPAAPASAAPAPAPSEAEAPPATEPDAPPSEPLCLGLGQRGASAGSAPGVTRAHGAPPSEQARRADQAAEPGGDPTPPKSWKHDPGF